MLKIYTDGASSPQKEHKVGGWGYIIVSDQTDKTFEDSGYEYPTTNIRMEALAIIRALEKLASFGRRMTVEVISDSEYCVKGMNEYLQGWVKKGWKNSTGKEVKNLDLWKRLYELDQKLDVTYTWVRGHDGNHYNEIADKLAVSAKHQGIHEWEQNGNNWQRNNII